jgi:hypothetical protein
MELNSYQNIIKSDLLRYLECWADTLDARRAWAAYWQGKSGKAPRDHQDAIAGTPAVCV